MPLNASSTRRMAGVDPRLVELVKAAREISPIPFEITEGLRTRERQAYLVKTHKSKTMKSKHLVGRAIDFVAMPDGKVSWNLSDYKTIVEKGFKPAAKRLGLTDVVTYGVYWKTIVDGPHVEIA